jgi:trigger factor
MSATIKKLPQGMVEITCEISVEDIKNELENAARKLTEDKPMPGFRPGKASYDMVKQAYGEMPIYETALPAIVRKHYVKAVTENHIHSYGEPKMEVTKLAPGNPIVFTATVAAVPDITLMPDYRSIKVESKEPKVEDSAIEATLKELQTMHTAEVRANHEATEKSKVVVDMDLSIAGVPLDGGQARNHGIFLNEEYYIPGLKEKVLGMKEGEKRDFSLKFNDDHFQKNIAGKDVDFTVTLKEVYDLEHPPINDDLAKKVGQESVEKLRTLIKENMLHEAATKESQRVELAILDQLVEKGRFEDVPEVILNDEVKRMIDELKHGVSEQGATWPDYLLNIKKTEDELKMEFVPQAVKRVKTAVLIREIGEKEEVEVSDEELLAEIGSLINRYAGNAEAQAQIRTEDYQDYVRSSMRNRKVLAMIRDSATGKK